MEALKEAKRGQRYVQMSKTRRYRARRMFDLDRDHRGVNLKTPDVESAKQQEIFRRLMEALKEAKRDQRYVFFCIAFS